MTTLVIHPTDITTDFLKEIYANKDWTIINHNPSKRELREAIKSHERIIMLGHGTEDGLIGHKRLVIDSTWVYLLREKDCVCIWCNADVFVKRYDLKGFYTGMIVSEYDEAIYCCISDFKAKDITESNLLFAKAITENISETVIAEKVLQTYTSTTNNIIAFNKANIYQRQ